MRYLTPFIREDLVRKMVFLAGPRQCGKTTLANDILKTWTGGRYFNWDDDDDKRALLKKEWHNEDHLLVFDEIHKFPRWKNWIKGIFDKRRERQTILVTGSARLDVYRRGGDSLLGRYHLWRLHPFDLSELPAKMSSGEAFKRLLNVGGFPEPFLDGDERQAKRWRKERFDRVLRDDVRDLERIREISTLALFADALRARVGSPVVLSNIAQDLQIAPKTAAAWLALLERMYVVFTIRPLTEKIARAVLKPPKVYFFDNADVLGDEGARFENLVATHLLKRIQFLEDRDGDRYELRYIRDKEGREVDFAVVKDGRLTELWEAKFADKTLHKPLIYYANRLRPQKAVQVLARLEHRFSHGGLCVEKVTEAFVRLDC